MWCCVGSGLENHGKYGELIYAHNDQDLFVNLFIPSILQWKEKDLKIEQAGFPDEQKTKLRFTLRSPIDFVVHVRYPSWITSDKLKVMVNGKAVMAIRDDNAYITIRRTWKTGDMLTIELPMEIKAEFLPDSADWVSFVRGPIVLAAITDTAHLEGLYADDSRMGHIAKGPLYPIEDAPMIVSKDKDFAKELRPVKGKPFTYSAASLIYPEQFKNLQLVPFYSIHDARYMLYWRYSTPEQLPIIKEELRKAEGAKMALETITVDKVAPGEQQPETDHNFKGENSETGIYRERHWRHAVGWFSYDLRNNKREARILRVTYSGGDKGRNFDILINDQLLTDVKLVGNKDKDFIDVDYPLSPGILNDEGSKKLTVKFVAHPGSIAGGVYDIRLLR
jgi:hypothetical protein